MDTNRTRELFAPLIQRPTLTDQLLQRPPFKFIHDIVHETLSATGYLHGVFSDEELDSAKAGSSRDTKVAFLQKLIDVLNVDGHLDDVKPAKIVAGREPELTNLLLQSLASEAGIYASEKRAAEKAKSSSSKSKSSSKIKDEDGGGSNNSKKSKKDRESKEKREKTEERSKHKSRDREKESDSKKREKIEEKSKHKSRDREEGVKTRDREKEIGAKTKLKSEEEKKRSKSRDTKASKEAEKPVSKDKDRRKKRSDSVSRSKTTAAATTPAKVESPKGPSIIVPDVPQGPEGIYQTDLHGARTPPDRESSGGTSKGGDDSGIAEETGAESERHDSERYTTNAGSTHDFIEVHPSGSSPVPVVPIRPGTAIGRPQTAIGRPGTAVARPAPPKPKKNIISTTTAPEAEKPDDTPQQNFALLLEEEETKKIDDDFLVEEDEDQLLLMDTGGLGTAEGANVAKLQEGDDHGVLVNRIVENTRKLEEEHLQEEEEGVSIVEESEQRRIRGEIESVQRNLQRATQCVQPLVRTLDLVADDFEGMLRELEECRKQTALLERQLHERSQHVGAHNAQLSGTLRALNEEIRDTRDQLTKTSAAVLANEHKLATLLMGGNEH